MKPTVNYEAHCSHCRAGVLSRDSLVMVDGEHLCVRCCQAREKMLARVRRLSGFILLGCTLAGAGIGYLVGRVPGVVIGPVVGLVCASIIESLLRRY
ncbi:MAG: hypothetical protein GX774_05475 [Armatimonadetes bacterium]|jgi:hypothetical protein|nr:hypothetical protein [Armatimonadota bacterium]